MTQPESKGHSVYFHDGPSGHNHNGEGGDGQGLCSPFLGQFPSASFCQSPRTFCHHLTALPYFHDAVYLSSRVVMTHATCAKLYSCLIARPWQDVDLPWLHCLRTKEYPRTFSVSWAQWTFRMKFAHPNSSHRPPPFPCPFHLFFPRQAQNH